VPKPYDDGTNFVIADIKRMVGGSSKKQIILEPVHFRLEDIRIEVVIGGGDRNRTDE
jgi:hypothetical protein